MNRKQQQPREQDEIRILGRKLEQRLVPEEVQKLSEKADGLEESFNSRKLKAWHMLQEAGAAGDFRTLKMIDKLTAQYDMVSCSDDIADFMERNHGNDILEEVQG